MKGIKLPMLCILLYALLAHVAAAEIVLQNGDDYSGCEDTYIDDKKDNSNFGDSDKIGTKYEICHA